MSGFEFHNFDIIGPILVKKKKFDDHRGAFLKEFENLEFSRHFSVNFLEEYISISKKDVLRGLHFQKPPKEQGKYITVIKGEVLDIAVDIRNSSDTYLCHIRTILSETSQESLWIPPGFAHGFLTLTKESIVISRATNEHSASLESGIRWDDPHLGIEWPISKPILSTKDAGFELLQA